MALLRVGVVDPNIPDENGNIGQIFSMSFIDEV
jgi:hypothetical protein